MEYQDIRKRLAEEEGLHLTDDEFEYAVWYARRKAEVAGKDESYLPYLLPDVIREMFIRAAINATTYGRMSKAVVAVSGA